jgi:hypothetical protein
MRANGISNMLHIDHTQRVALRRFFNEDLVVEIVSVVSHKALNHSHDLQNIES